jgi:hypothetical protein
MYCVLLCGIVCYGVVLCGIVIGYWVLGIIACTCTSTQIKWI